jgi:hypothetical protein
VEFLRPTHEAGGRHSPRHDVSMHGECIVDAPGRRRIGRSLIQSPDAPYHLTFESMGTPISRREGRRRDDRIDELEVLRGRGG